MTNPELKVSEKVRELSKSIAPKMLAWERYPISTEDELAILIQSALSELLDAIAKIDWMAKSYAEGGGMDGPEMRDYESFAAILSKWEPPR